MNSDQQRYILHVGAESDLSVNGGRLTPQSPSPSSAGNPSNVTAHGNGQQCGRQGRGAQTTKVDVTLPEGLTYSSHDARQRDNL